jgi:hypothetical protein
MILTRLETVETELKCKRYSQNKVLKLRGLKRQSRGHQECLKRIRDGKVMAKTRFKGFSVKNRASRGLTARNQGPNHKYVYKPKVYSAKGQVKDLGWDFQKDQGLRYKRKDLYARKLKGGGTGMKY